MLQQEFLVPCSSSWKPKAQGNTPEVLGAFSVLISTCNGRHQEEGPGLLFSGAQWHDKGQWAQIRTQHKLENSKFHPNLRKSLLAVRMPEHEEKLSGEVIESPSLERLQTVWGTILLQQGGGLHDLQRSLPIPHHSVCASV